MIGLDTNVLVRYLTQDDAAQFQEAAALLHDLEQRGLFAHLSAITLCETVWVLARAYKIERAKIAAMLEQLLATSLFVIADKDAVREALGLYRTSSGDFADYLTGVLAHRAGCSTVATFDVALHDHPELFCAPATALKAALKKAPPKAKPAPSVRAQPRPRG